MFDWILDKLGLVRKTNLPDTGTLLIKYVYENDIVLHEFFADINTPIIIKRGYAFKITYFKFEE